MSAVNLGSVGRRGDPARASRTLHIDWTRCDGRGLCTELLAEVLVRDEWGYPVAARQAAGSRSDVLVPDGADAAARDAVALCPRQALRLR